MENCQPMSTEKESESKVATSGDSIESQLVAVTEEKESANSSQPTTATIQNASPKTWTSAELKALQSKAGLVAGALADFQSAGGLVALTTIEYRASGSEFTATKLVLVADGLNLVAVETEDGLDFQITEI